MSKLSHEELRQQLLADLGEPPWRDYPLNELIQRKWYAGHFSRGANGIASLDENSKVLESQIPERLSESSLLETFIAWGPAPNGVDDLASVQTALDTLPAGGTLILRAGNYRFPTGGIILNRRLHIIGAGRTHGSPGGTKLICTSTTADLFTFQVDGCTISKITLSNEAASAPTAGSGIKVSSADAGNYFRILDCDIKGFWVNIHVASGHTWIVDGCYILGPVKYGLYVSNPTNPDAGDACISNTWFTSDTYEADAAIRQESGGGLKLSNIKINAAGGAGGAFRFIYGYELALSSGTSDLLFSNCSIENTRTLGLYCHQLGAATASFYNIVISGCQFALYSDVNSIPIKVSPENGSRPFLNVSISGTTFLGATGQVAPAIDVHNTNHIGIDGSCTFLNFPTKWRFTGCANARPPLEETIWVPAPQFLAAFGAPTLTQQQRHPVWLLDPTSVEYIAAELGPLPQWNAYVVDLYWTNAGAGVGDVKWRCDFEYKGDGETLTAAGTGSTGATVTAPAQDVVKVTTFPTLTPTLKKPVSLRINRHASDVADTLTTDASVLGIMLRKVS